MSKFYEVLTSSPMGDPWGEGNKNQTYWTQLEGIDLSVTVTKQKALNPGDQIYGDIITDDGKPFQGAKSQFYKFKGAMIPQGTPRPQSSGNATPAPKNVAVDDSVVPQWFNPYAIMLKQIHDALRTGDAPAPKEEPFTEEKVEAPATEKIGGGEISKAELEDIFGGEMADPVDLPSRGDNDAKESQ